MGIVSRDLEASIFWHEASALSEKMENGDRPYVYPNRSPDSGSASLRGRPDCPGLTRRPSSADISSLNRTPPTRFIRAIQVPSGFDGADANIAEALSMRNFLEELRGSGVQTGGPAAFSQADRQAFGAALDRFLAKAVKKPQD